MKRRITAAFLAGLISVICSADDTNTLRLAIADLVQSGNYPRGAEFIKRLDAVKSEAEFRALQREALLANPLLDFDRILVIRRTEKQLGLPHNWQGNSCLPDAGYDNEIAVLTIGRDEPLARPPQKKDADDPAGHPYLKDALTTLYKPEKPVFVGDVDLDFDGQRMVFSMLGYNGRWQIFEMKADGTALKQLPLIQELDVDNYDACYLPDGDIIFSSSAPFIGVPCVRGSSHVANLYRWYRATGQIRRLTFDQDHDWCPTTLSDGRILYLRWEYSDIPHYVSRILFTMNPDGTNQREFGQ